MTMTLTNKQTTYNATKIDEALGIKLDGQATINNSGIIAWQGSIYKDEEYVGNFYYSDNNGRTNINIDTPIGMVDILNTNSILKLKIMITMTNKQEVWDATKVGTNLTLQGQVQAMHGILHSWNGNITNTEGEYLGSFYWSKIGEEVNININSKENSLIIHELIDESINEIIIEINEK